MRFISNWNQYGSITTSQLCKAKKKKTPFCIDELIIYGKNSAEIFIYLFHFVRLFVHLTWIDFFFLSFFHSLNVSLITVTKAAAPDCTYTNTKLDSHTLIFIRRNSHFQIGLIPFDWMRFFKFFNFFSQYFAINGLLCLSTSFEWFIYTVICIMSSFPWIEPLRLLNFFLFSITLYKLYVNHNNWKKNLWILWNLQFF